MCLVVGEEEYLSSRVVRALRDAALQGGVPGLNDEEFRAGETGVETVLGVARTMPMMARRRFVLVRQLERWEGRGEASKGAGGEAFDRLAEYAASPAPDTVLVLVGTKIDRRRRLVTAAKKGGWLVTCEPLSRRDLPRWIDGFAAECGGRLATGVAELVAELTGPELAPVVDAVERLVLYAGAREVTEDDVGECLVRIRPTEVWALTDAVGRRDLARALSALDRVYDPRDAGRLVGVLAWSTRQLVRFEAALRHGATPPEAAQLAGAPPFKARELADQVRRTTPAALEAWLETLGRVDLGLKGGTKRPAKAVFESAIMSACQHRTALGRRRGAPNAP